MSVGRSIPVEAVDEAVIDPSQTPGNAGISTAHDESPASVLADLSSDEVTRLGDELMRTRDGQVVLGRAVSAQEAARWKPRDYARAARETFQLLAPLYRLT